LISRLGKKLRSEGYDFETGQSSNQPVKARLRPWKSRFSPLQQTLLPTNARWRKEQKDTSGRERYRSARR
jgi:hypothetical protein